MQNNKNECSKHENSSIIITVSGFRPPFSISGSGKRRVRNYRFGRSKKVTFTWQTA